MTPTSILEKIPYQKFLGSYNFRAVQENAWILQNNPRFVRSTK